MTEVPGSGLALFLERSHTVSPQQVPQLVDEAAWQLGLASAAAYLADVQKDQSVPLPGTTGGHGHPTGALAIGLTLQSGAGPYRRSQRFDGRH
ncbi:hypothetical protein [Streptomyces cadmiisoli]|uniref:hypothetical protein n=1 Tax=Streptomyces cadmiisoli TaxID=2184053 RepID=UPI00364BDE52